MGREPEQCLLLQLLPVKGGVERGKERVLCEVSRFKVVRDPVWGGSSEIGVEPWDRRGRGWG